MPCEEILTAGIRPASLSLVRGWVFSPTPDLGLGDALRPNFQQRWEKSICRTFR